MKFKKGTFIIQMIEAADNQFEEREGWTSSCGRYGFHKSSDKKRWIATELASGMMICRFKTRSECAEFIEKFPKKIVAAKGSDKYHNALAAMCRYKKGMESLD